MSAKNAILKAKVENEIVEIMLKASAENTFLADGTTVAAKIAAMVADISGKATPADVSKAVSDAVDGIIDGAPGTYDTLKEISDYIDAHEEVVTALNAAIGDKVSKEEGKGLSANDFTDELKAKLESIEAGNIHTHDNKAVLDGITAAKVSEWDAKAVVGIGTSVPETMKNGEFFIQLTAAE